MTRGETFSCASNKSLMRKSPNWKQVLGVWQKGDCHSLTRTIPFTKEALAQSVSLQSYCLATDIHDVYINKTTKKKKHLNLKNRTLSRRGSCIKLFSVVSSWSTERGLRHLSVCQVSLEACRNEMKSASVFQQSASEEPSPTSCILVWEKCWITRDMMTLLRQYSRNVTKGS